MAWIFDEFRLDADRYLLTCGGEEIHLEPRVFETLTYLVRHRDRVVSKEELVAEVWAGAHISDATLKRAVQEARRALGDSGDRQEWIETVYGRGYRFVAEALAEQAAEGEPADVADGAGRDLSPPRLGSSSVRRTSSPWLSVLAALVLVGAVASALLLFVATWRKAPSRSERGPLRLLVLPFDSIGEEANWLAAGLTEEVTTRMAAIEDLAVISRTTAEHYAADGRTLAEIGREVGVDYVLEGAVQVEEAASPARVKVTAQLVRVEGDDHVWASTLERHLDDVFAVQSEVAQAVVGRLDIGLSERARGRLASPPTDHVDAYRAYVVAGDLLRQGRPAGAVDLLQRAVTLDPEFALAWAGLAGAHTVFLLGGTDTTPERRELAERALDRATELAPDHPAVRLTRVLYAWRVEVDHEAGLQELDSMLDETPHMSSALALKHQMLQRLGRFAEALEIGKLASQLDPDPEWLHVIGWDYGALGEHEAAERYLDEAIAKTPGQLSAYLLKAWHQLSWRGDLQTARSVLESMPNVDEPPPGTATFAWWPVLLAERKYDEALERLEATHADILWNQWTHWPKGLMRAQVHRLRGDPEAARAELEAVLPDLESTLEKRSGNVLARSRHHAALGLTLAGLGRHDEALRHGLQAVELGGLETDALIGPFRLEELAEIYLLSGEPERAIEILEALVSAPCRISPVWLRLDPRWDRLRTHPRFERLLAGRMPFSGQDRAANGAA